jgi:hypothetical protein
LRRFVEKRAFYGWKPVSIVRLSEEFSYDHHL